MQTCSRREPGFLKLLIPVYMFRHSEDIFEEPIPLLHGIMILCKIEDYIRNNVITDITIILLSATTVLLWWHKNPTVICHFVTLRCIMYLSNVSSWGVSKNSFSKIMIQSTQQFCYSRFKEFALSFMPKHTIIDYE